jgi:hypothetical protein
MRLSRRSSSGRNASGSVRKHEVSRRAPHEQDGLGFLAASALFFAYVHPTAQKMCARKLRGFEGH